MDPYNRPLPPLLYPVLNPVELQPKQGSIQQVPVFVEPQPVPLSAPVVVAVEAQLEQVPQANCALALREAWHLLWRNVWVVLGFSLIYFGWSWAVSLWATLFDMRETHHYILAALPGLLVSQKHFYAGLFYAVFKVLRTNEPMRIGDLFFSFSKGRLYLRLVVIECVAVVLALTSFFFKNSFYGGIAYSIFLIWFSLSQLFLLPLVVENPDSRLCPLVVRSAKATHLSGCSMIGFLLTSIGLVLAAACSIVGLFFVLPLVMFHLAFLYRQLVGVKEDLGFTFIPPPEASSCC